MRELSNQYIEFYKAFFEYLKHLTTLSTGSVILLAAFLEKLFVQPSWKPLVAVALVGFMISVIASVAAHTILLSHLEPIESKEDWEEGPSLPAVVISWLGFLLGIISLTVFAIKNLFQ